MDCVSDVTGYSQITIIFVIPLEIGKYQETLDTAFIKCISVTCLVKAAPSIAIFSI